MRTLTASNVPIVIKDNNVEVRMTEVGDMTASIIRLAKGTDLAPALVGLPGDLCPCPHWGYMLEGRLLMHTTNGDQIYEAGQAFYWPPGHSSVALEDCGYVDFSPTESLNAVIRHFQGAER